MWRHNTQTLVFRHTHRCTKQRHINTDTSTQIHTDIATYSYAHMYVYIYTCRHTYRAPLQHTQQGAGTRTQQCGLPKTRLSLAPDSCLCPICEGVREILKPTPTPSPPRQTPSNSVPPACSILFLFGAWAHTRWCLGNPVVPVFAPVYPARPLHSSSFRLRAEGV